MYEFDPIIIAVGLSKKIVVMKSFSDDEKHAGLHDLVQDFEDETEAELPPGIYKVWCYIVNPAANGNPENDWVYLEIGDTEKLFYEGE